MKISVDIDGVLADQVGAALKMIEKEYGQDLLEAMVIAPIGGSEKRYIWSEIDMVGDRYGRR